jgi:hypothetical protein
MPELTLHHRLRRQHASVFRSPKRFKIVVAGRRWGKTWLAVWWLVVSAFSGPDRICYYIAPNYRQAKRIAWEVLKQFVPITARRRTNEQELCIQLRNGSIIQLHGADNPDSLRGVGLDSVEENINGGPSRYGIYFHLLWKLVVGKNRSVRRTWRSAGDDIPNDTTRFAATPHLSVA